ncbi:carbonic anhydrase [Streptomyces sp. NBC_00237]|uniref:carbonic anhydrase n=1 Tax=Streptomyces sp. NBC_00237 TaxID=2975687 RepID=UPI00224E03BE|nr:carbonic anhydrase [Streptomyces sp. NBC_00237]MCX5204867.1 carbonic anhydrase [Streptomyces sp. NBC_00237]
MRQLIDHTRTFRSRYHGAGRNLQDFAGGQRPSAMFITCSDSRVVPTLLTGSGPGELFELRTAGNIVPAYDPDAATSEMATIEYAVCVLEVSDIILCGHSHCGAVGALARGEDLATMPAVRGWLDRSTPAGGGFRSPEGIEEPDDFGPDVARPVQRHVVAQLEKLRAYPCVSQAAGEGRLGLHAWYYEVHTGAVQSHRVSTGTFSSL